MSDAISDMVKDIFKDPSIDLPKVLYMDQSNESHKDLSNDPSKVPSRNSKIQPSMYLRINAFNISSNLLMIYS